MNKILLSTLLFFLCTSQFHAQEFSMTDQGNKWALRWFDGHCDNNDDPDIECDETGLILVRINGEVIINNTTYAVLEGSFTSGAMFIREDQGIVYQYIESSGEEHILYDFTLEVGDSIEISSISGCISDENQNNLADVIDVSTQFIAGQNRKVITFDILYGSNFSEHLQWIEGLGSANDPTNPDFYICDFVVVIDCFNNGEEIFSFSSFEEECFALLDLPENSNIETKLTPNPIIDQSRLTINNFQNNTMLSFYNILGQFIYQKEMTNTSIAINRSDFPSSGIYFYQIKQNGVVVDTQKFIVK